MYVLWFVAGIIVGP